MLPSMHATADVAELYMRATALADQFGPVRRVRIDVGRVPGARYLTAEIELDVYGADTRSIITLNSRTVAEITILRRHSAADSAPSDYPTPTLKES